MGETQESKDYLVFVGAIVRKDRRILFTLRKKGPRAGSWGFPSDLVEPGETLETGRGCRSCGKGFKMASVTHTGR